ncbi:MAG TPA: extracellular solute-binding protein [Candidatus Pelethenecus faecipullorum]|uniref:Extracellular solute-binding protein n=1 Tax=Candidatus Pelethenecus faecipullorum TaxID=2840900 RepID=A0A9D1GRE9_9MOLU|nr:extracellular solute-binding protein [Candidatus Pelethenecus faecipullorum]
MKKKLFGALIAAVAGLSLSSCTSKDYSHIIVFWHTMGDSLQQVLQPAVDQFEEDNPGWEIEHLQVGGYDDVRNQTIAYIAAGNNPSLVYCYPDHIATYNQAGVVVDLNKYINDPEVGFTQAQKDDFIEGFYNEGASFGDDKMYSLPFSKSTEVLYYNKTFFDDEGLEVPTTWEEMEEVCRIIKLRYKDSIPLGIDSEANFFITTAEQKGAAYTSATGEHYLFDNAQNRETVAMLEEWFDKGYCTTQTILGTYTSSLFVSTSGQKSYMSIGSTGGANHQKPSGKAFEVGIAPIPTFVKSVSPATESLKCISQGPSLAMLNQPGNEEKMKMTWLFMKDYLLTTEFQAKFSMASGYNPVLESVYDNAVYKTFLAGADESFATVESQNVTALSASVSRTLVDNYFVSPAFMGSSTARDEVGNLIVNVLRGTDIDRAFKDAINNCKA